MKTQSFYKEKVTIDQPSFSTTLPLSKEVNTLKVNVVGGNLSIEAGRYNEAAIKLLWNNRTALPQFGVQGNTLFLTAKGLSAFWRQRNAFVYHLVIPPNLSVNVQMMAGVISLKGLTGSLQLNIATGGSIEGIISSSQVKARIRAGDIRFSGVSAGDVQVKTFMGDVELIFQEVNKKAYVNMRSTLGDVIAQFPSYVAPHYKKGKITNALEAVCFASTLLGDVKVSTANNENTRP